MLSDDMINKCYTIITVSISMLSVIYAEYHNAERHFAKCHSTECHSAQCRGTRRNQFKFYFYQFSFSLLVFKESSFLPLFVFLSFCLFLFSSFSLFHFLFSYFTIGGDYHVAWDQYYKTFFAHILQIFVIS
jgi:hypothetical protein